MNKQGLMIRVTFAILGIHVEVASSQHQRPLIRRQSEADHSSEAVNLLATQDSTSDLEDVTDTQPWDELLLKAEFRSSYCDTEMKDHTEQVKFALARSQAGGASITSIGCFGIFTCPTDDDYRGSVMFWANQHFGFGPVLCDTHSQYIRFKCKNGFSFDVTWGQPVDFSPCQLLDVALGKTVTGTSSCCGGSLDKLVDGATAADFDYSSQGQGTMTWLQIDLGTPFRQLTTRLFNSNMDAEGAKDISIYATSEPFEASTNVIQSPELFDIAKLPSSQKCGKTPSYTERGSVYQVPCAMRGEEARYIIAMKDLGPISIREFHVHGIKASCGFCSHACMRDNGECVDSMPYNDPKVATAFKRLKDFCIARKMTWCPKAANEPAVKACAEPDLLNDFSSMEAMQDKGWRFASNDKDRFKPRRTHLAPEVEKGSWWGLTDVSYNLQGKGTAVLNFGSGAQNCDEDDEPKKVSVLLSGNRIKEAPCGQSSTQLLIPFVDGDVLEIGRSQGLVMIHSLHLTCETGVRRCNGNYGSQIGTPVCCGQDGKIETLDSICTEANPVCVGYSDGSTGEEKQLGRCYETDEPTSKAKRADDEKNGFAHLTRLEDNLEKMEEAIADAQDAAKVERSWWDRPFPMLKAKLGPWEKLLDANVEKVYEKEDSQKGGPPFDPTSPAADAAPPLMPDEDPIPEQLKQEAR